MATSKGFESPLLRVSRVSSACVRCRSAKVKCDGRLPACGACERAGRAAQCSSANEQFAKGKERNYVASLETRVERLERQIAEAKSQNTTVNSLDSKLLPQSSSNPDARSSLLDRRKLDRSEARDVDDLVADFGFLSVNATARDFHGFTKEMSFAKLVLSTSCLLETPKFAINTLPQRYAIAPLIEYYLDRVHVLYPFLSETRVFASLDALCNENGRHATPMDHWMIRMVLAVTLSSLSVRRGDVKYQDATRHVAAALEVMESVIQPGSVLGVQAILLLVIYALLDPRRFNSWYLMGTASRELVDLGMHQDHRAEELKPSEADLRLQIFGCVYTLDRSISMIHHRTFSFSDDSTNVRHPNERATASKPVFHRSIGPAIHLLKLRQLQSKYYQKIYQSHHIPLCDTWPIVFDAVRETHQWMLSSLNSVDKQARNLFRCESFYTNIVFLTPPGWIDALPDYGKFLMFEFIIEYAELIYSVVSIPERAAFYTSHQLWQTSFVANRFVALLSTDLQLLLGDVGSQAVANFNETMKVVELPYRPVVETVNKALECLDLVERTLEYLGLKFGYSDPLNDFRSTSSGLRQTISLQTTSQSSASGISPFGIGQ